MSLFPVISKSASEVIGATNEMDRVGDSTFDGVRLLDLGILEEELVLETESGIVPHRFPRSVTVLPNSDQEMSVVFDAPLAVPLSGALDVVDRENPLVWIRSAIEVYIEKTRR
jgi:hypothetical protein